MMTFPGEHLRPRGQRWEGRVEDISDQIPRSRVASKRITEILLYNATKRVGTVY